MFVLSLTSQGEWVDRCDYSDLLQELQGSPDPITLVLYIHGWKHGPDSLDRYKFEALVGQIATKENELWIRASQSTTRSDEPRRVVGIYIGWPGETVAIPVIRELTYWGRQKAADRISQSGIVAKIISGIRSVRLGPRLSTLHMPADRVDQRRREDHFIYIGHSFGARILLNATAQLQIEAVERSHPGNLERIVSRSNINPRRRDAAPYACIDSGALSILLNPAVEAFTFSSFHNVRRSDHSFSSIQQPVMLVVASENDEATKIAFPLGQALGLNWHEKELSTIGNYPQFQTHTLQKEGHCDSRGDRWYDGFSTTTGICLQRHSHDRPSFEDIQMGDSSPANSLLTANQAAGDAERYPNYSGNPFLVARASREVVNGHNGIWQPSFSEWLTEFIAKANAERKVHPCL
ncbi:MAG: hypothetical protein Q8M80_12935 [Hydrogenophaga sp.]|nr:hypothetical protein [Hydrogenophaga sp.]